MQQYKIQNKTTQLSLGLRGIALKDHGINVDDGGGDDVDAVAVTAAADYENEYHAEVDVEVYASELT